MKILKTVLFIILGIVVIALVAALFVDNKYVVTRSITINQPKTIVFEYLKSLKSQNDWSAWGKRDPNMKIEFSGIDGTVGFTSKWKGNDDVGEGEQEIKEIVDGERIENELRFLKPWKTVTKPIFITEAVNENNTKVSWQLQGSSPYPWNLMNVANSMDHMIGKDFE
jgi:hypothetical protein